MQRGRRVARTATLTALVALGTTFFINPDLFSSQLRMPSAEERAEAKKLRKKNQSKKPKRRLTKQDIERLAKLRESRARKHMMEILRRLEQRIVIAEKKEAEVTAKFRKDPRLFSSLRNLIPRHAIKLNEHLGKDRQRWDQSAEGGHRDRKQYLQLSRLFQPSWNLLTLGRQYQHTPTPDKLDTILSNTRLLESNLKKESFKKLGLSIEKQTHRYLKSVADNARAIKTQDRDLAVRGFAQPEDHPLTQSQRRDFNRTISPMTMARLHELSQEMATHYVNLMGDVEAGKLADVANIPLPEALDRLAHQPFAEDDLQEPLKQNTPENTDELDEFSAALNEAQISAERALTEAGGKVPGKNGEDKKKSDSDKSGSAEEGKGPFGSGGGNGTENTSQQGAPSARGQRSQEQILRSLALESGLGAAQDRSRQITVNKKKVLANVLPGRRFSANSPRKGYLFIDTWHIIGPWDATAAQFKKIDFSTIYPPETRLNLDATYTTGKTHRVYDDERGYSGKDKLSGRLTWQFYQSPTVEVRIPREQLANDALYFAYTEVFFEQEMTMNLAIASDDAARIRVNGQIVFEDTGLSPYAISEQVRRVKFKKGINKILVRLVNGPGPCRFSLLLTPQ